MPGLIIDSTAIDVPGLTIASWRDDPRLRLRIGQADGVSDGRPRRTRWIRSIILHTTKGIPGGKDRRPQKVLPGLGPTGTAAESVARWWSTSGMASGAHLVCDFDGTWVCLADLATECAYHATTVNDISIGIEIWQGSDAELYEQQLDSVVTMVDFLIAHFGIQRQVPDAYRGPIPRLEGGGADCVGVFGHRDQTDNRGPGDPGDAIMDRLRAAGYESFDFAAGADLTIWRQRQQALNARDGAALQVDGIAGPAVVAHQRQHGYPGGLWTTHQALVERRLRDELDALARRYGDQLSRQALHRVVQCWLG